MGLPRPLRSARAPGGGDWARPRTSGGRALTDRLDIFQIIHRDPGLQRKIDDKRIALEKARGPQRPYPGGCDLPTADLALETTPRTAAVRLQLHREVHFSPRTPRGAAARLKFCQELRKSAPRELPALVHRAESLLATGSAGLAGACCLRGLWEQPTGGGPPEKGFRAAFDELRQRFPRDLHGRPRDEYVRTRPGTHDGYHMEVCAVSGQLLRPLKSRPGQSSIAAPEVGVGEAASAPLPAVHRRQRPSEAEHHDALMREFDLVTSRLDIVDLLGRSIREDEASRQAAVRSVIAVLRRNFPFIKRVMTTYAAMDAVASNVAGGASTGNATEAFTISRAEFQKLCQDMLVVDGLLTQGKLDVIFVRANWARDPTTGKAVAAEDDEGNSSQELVTHEVLGVLVRMAAAKYVAMDVHLADKVRRRRCSPFPPPPAHESTLTRAHLPTTTATGREAGRRAPHASARGR